MASRTRRPLTRDRVLQAALELADAGGFESLTMRRLATQLRVEAMSLYNHVANKEDIVDGLVDLVFGEIEVAAPGEQVAERVLQRGAAGGAEAAAEAGELGGAADADAAAEAGDADLVGLVHDGGDGGGGFLGDGQGEGVALHRVDRQVDAQRLEQERGVAAQRDHEAVGADQLVLGGGGGAGGVRPGPACGRVRPGRRTAT